MYNPIRKRCGLNPLRIEHPSQSHCPFSSHGNKVSEGEGALDVTAGYDFRIEKEMEDVEEQAQRSADHRSIEAG